MKNKPTFQLKLLLVLPLLCGVSSTALACDACKKQQPKILQGITHGAGPDSNWDYLVVTAMIVITLYTLFATIKCLMRPAENDSKHIKRMILNR